MTSDQFRKLALSLDGAAENSHQGHPDFRAHGKIFATLHWPDESWGMVKLSCNDQKRFAEMQPDVFVPVKGKWGQEGSTNVCLRTAKPDIVKYALHLAWANSAAVSSPKKRNRNSG